MRNLTSQRWLLAIIFVAAAIFAAADPIELEQGRAALAAKDYASAQRLLQPLAQSGNAVAQNALGVMYRDGWGFARDDAAALSWFTKAAEQGNDKAQFHLGGMHAGGKGTPQDYAQASKWFRLAAEQGYAPGQSALATMYGLGDGVARDAKQAMHWYARAAEQNYAPAQTSLGAMYATGEAGQRDYQRAQALFRQALAQDYPRAAAWLARLYVEGWGVGRDLNEAAKLYNTALEGYRKGGKTIFDEIPARENAAWARLLWAMAATPEDLAVSYLGVSEYVELALQVKNGQATHLPVHGRKMEAGAKPEVVWVDRANVDAFLQVQQERADIYAAAIKARGFTTLSTEYVASPQGCLAGSVLKQSGFNAPLVGGYAYRGAMVESTLVIQFGGNRKDTRHLVGRVDHPLIELKEEAPGTCVVTLAPR